MSDETLLLYAGQIHSILSLIKDTPDLLESEGFSSAIEKVLLDAPAGVLLISTARLIDLTNRLKAKGK